jgi:hypothetical protein
MLAGIFGCIRIFFRQLQVIFIAEIEQIELVTAHQFKAFVQAVDLVQIQIKHKDIVMEAMHFRRQTVVHHLGFIQARINYRLFHHSSMYEVICKTDG